MATRALLATDKSLALELRDKLYEAIMGALPSGTVDKYYDTQEMQSKGFRPGYISFALHPTQFDSAGDKGLKLIGGILIKGQYPSKVIKSEAPDSSDTQAFQEWKNQGGTEAFKDEPAETIDLEVGYYNKKAEGGYQRQQDAGKAVISVNPMEEIELILENESATAKAIQDVIQDVVNDPPEEAYGAAAKRSRDPYRSRRAYFNYIRERAEETGEAYITDQEIDELARRTIENPTQQHKDQLARWFTQRGWQRR